jgi:hypothetical protein
MNREAQVQADLQTHQLEHDRDMRAIERLHGLISTGAKGLSILGGGAAVALSAFIPALIDKGVYLGFKWFSIGGLASFLMAALLPTIAFFFHFQYLNKYLHPARSKFLLAVWALLASSAFFLFFGGLCVLIGVWVAL